MKMGENRLIFPRVLRWSKSQSFNLLEAFSLLESQRPKNVFVTQQHVHQSHSMQELKILVTTSLQVNTTLVSPVRRCTFCMLVIFITLLSCTSNVMIHVSQDGNNSAASLINQQTTYVQDKRKEHLLKLRYSKTIWREALSPRRLAKVNLPF